MEDVSASSSHDGVEFEGNYSVEEINEYVATMTKLMVVRDVVLKVNQEYIRSAGMEEQYRTAPPFRLQGSYRNMNRIASKVLPVLNDEELWTLIYSSYENDAQTLTTGAEANLLKFGELVGRLSAERAKRWEDIKKTFRKNLLFAGVGADDKLGLVIRQLGAFSDSLGSIKDVLAGGLHAVTAARAEPPQPPPALPPETVARLDALLAELRTKRTEIETQAAMVEQVPKTLVAVLEEQFDAMETWLTPVMKSAQGRAEYIQSLIERFATMVEGYSRLIDVLKERKQGIEADGDQPEQPPKPAKRRKKD